MQINKHVHAVRVPFSITGPSGLTVERFVYVYLIYGSGGITLIDSGVAGGVETIFDYIRKTDRRVSDIARIILTHAHPDHMGAARLIKGETGCAVEVHAAERAWVEDVALQKKERPVPDFDALVAGPLAVDRTRGDGEAFDLGCGLKLQIYHTPGHSRGSVSILLQGYRALFTGDAIPVPGALPVYEDAQESAASIRKLKAIPDVRHLLPSWDEPARGEEAYQRMDAGLAYLEKVHGAVRRCAAAMPGAGAGEICPRVLEELGLRPGLANPIVARSVASHMGLLTLDSIP
ncbi:MAG: MBL fold metallo-hydrolase [Thermodesulfovibrionales bacterium]